MFDRVRRSVRPLASLLAAATLATGAAAQSVQFAASSSASGEAAGVVQLQVTLTSVAAVPVSVPFSAAGSATAGADYTLAASPLLIPAGATSGVIAVTLTNDTTLEGRETVTVTLGAPTGATLGAATAHALRIDDDEAPATVQFLLSTTDHGEDAGAVDVTLQLSAPLTEPTTVEVALGGTATLGTDYTTSALPVVFPGGTTSRVVTVTTDDDGSYEPNETVELTLGAIDNAVAGAQALHTLTIRDDDAPPQVLFRSLGATLSEAGPALVVDVDLSEASGYPVSVVVTPSGSASDGVDYTWPGSPLVVPIGASSASFLVTPVNDADVEGTEFAAFTLSAPTNAQLGPRTVHAVTLLDDESVPNVEFAASASSHGEGAGVALIEVVLTHAPATAVSVPFTLGGTATTPDDYSTSASPVVFGVGETSRMIEVTLVDDSTPESTETVEVLLGAPTGAYQGGATLHTLSIQDNDSGVTAAFALALDSRAEGAGQVAVQVTLSGPAPAQVTLPFTLGGNAGVPGDLTAPASPLVIPTGATSGAIVLDLAQDSLHEADELVVLTLGAPTGATLGAVVQHTLTIVDDDPAPAVAFTAFRTVVDELSGGFNVRFQLSQVSGVDAIVPFSIGGDASGPGDIVAPSSPATIPAGQTFVDVPVGLVVDRVPELGERVVFRLDQPLVHATLGTITSLVVVINDGAAGAIPLPPALSGTPSVLAFAPARVLQSGGVQSVFVTNVHSAPLTFQGLAPESGATSAFVLSYPGYAVPMVLAPAQSVQVNVEFRPNTPGMRRGTFVVRQNFGGIPPTRLTFEGIALGVPPADVVMNAGTAPYVSPDRTYWSPDFGVVASEGLVQSVVDVLGTVEDPLYQVSRWGQLVQYALPLPNGVYDFRFRSWEPLLANPGTRVFDVTLEGQLAFDDLDVLALAGLRTAYVSPEYRVTVADGVLDIVFQASVARAIVSALEVRSVPLVDSPTSSLQFGTIDQGSFGQLDVELVNTGLAPGEVVSVQLIPGGTGPAHEFAVEIGANTYVGGTNPTSYAISLPLPAGQSVFVPVVFTPTIHRDNALEVRFNLAEGDPIVVGVTGTGGANAGWGFLHPVIDYEPLTVVDYDNTGAETIELLGSESHTHEPGRALTAFEWRVNGNLVASTADATTTLPLGMSTVSLTIFDSNPVPAQATDSKPINVYPASGVPGLLVRYYDGSVVGEVALLDNVPSLANYIERQGGFTTSQIGARVGGSPFAGDVMVQWNGSFVLASAATVTFTPQGGDGNRVYVDGVLRTAPVALSAGAHTLDVRFAVSDVGDLPLTLMVTAGGSPVPSLETTLTHDEAALRPVIHSMPTQGTDLGGNDIVIRGFGFFPKSQVVVNWGGTQIPHTQFIDYTPERIHLLSPPGSGPVQVSITTPNGTSNSETFQYSPSGPVPVRWLVMSDRQLAVSDPTRAQWGPDGRLWVALIDGSLRAVTYDDNWFVTNVQYYAGVSALVNKDILGLTFNPFTVYNPNDPTSLKVYVAHGELFQNGGGAFNEPSDFTGQVSQLSGPNFNTPVPVVSGLPVSNHDHSINGIEFDANGDLLICCGGNTNAGVTSTLMGDVPASPFSGAILKAFTSRPGFNGQIVYVDRTTQAVVTDQRYGETAIVAPGVDVEVYAPGFRNSYDLVLHSNGRIYATDNGPNDPFGPASLSLTTQGGNPHPTHPDELILVERGNYYGHPNRSRGYFDPRQTVYRSDLVASIAHQFMQRIALLDSSTNGIEEYRATAFNSQIRGDLAVMKWFNGIRLFELTSDGRRVVNPSGAFQSPSNPGLDLAIAPGGALVSIDYSGDRVRVQVPDDVAAVGLSPYDVFPARAPSTGGMPFVIGGAGFGTNVNTSVTFDGVPAVLSQVTSKRIRGTIPALPNRLGAIDVAVTVNATTVTIADGFQALPPAPGLALGTWYVHAQMPVALGEVAAAEVNGMLYVFGQGDPRTLRYDVLNDVWSSTLAQRPHWGDHHACEVWNGRVYLIGGFGSAGLVQIYDPATNSWSLGAPMPWAGGSAASALINGRIYVAGGIVGASTVSNLAVYDPALNTWTSLGAMPLGVNHAAAATDGARLFVFGGRQGPNVPAPGFSNVQVYDPVTGTWQTSQNGQVAAMPLPRGGTGRAVWYRGELYVFGGEDASVAFGEVQAYNPLTDTWRLEQGMPTARHGIFPLVFQDRVFVLGGGTAAGFSMSALVEVFQRP